MASGRRLPSRCARDDLLDEAAALAVDAQHLGCRRDLTGQRRERARAQLDAGTDVADQSGPRVLEGGCLLCGGVRLLHGGDAELLQQFETQVRAGAETGSWLDL